MSTRLPRKVFLDQRIVTTLVLGKVHDIFVCHPPREPSTGTRCPRAREGRLRKERRQGNLLTCQVLLETRFAAPECSVGNLTCMLNKHLVVKHRGVGLYPLLLEITSIDDVFEHA